MSFIRSWGKENLYQSLYTSVITASGDVTTSPTLLFYVLCTHAGGQTSIGSGATVELWDNGISGTKVIHLESASGDRSPFGLSTTKPILFENKLTVAFTATGMNVSLGYYNYSS